MTYLITDTHFSHTNIKKYCSRPDGFEELIFAGIESLPDSCKLIHLGDVAMGKEPVRWLERYNSLTNKKKIQSVLIVGNHDKKTKSFYHRYFDEVHDFLIVDNILLSHHGVDFTDTTNKHIPNIVEGQIYGHFHNSPLSARELAWENAFQLSLERENYIPIPLEEIRRRIRNNLKF